MTDKAYFQLLDSPLSGQDAAGKLYCSPSGDTIDLFRQVNGLHGNEMLYPGHFVVTPSLDGTSAQGLAGMQSLSQQVNYLQRNGAAGADPVAFNRDFDMLSVLSGNSKEAKAAGSYFKGASKYLETRLSVITKDFAELEKIYNRALLQGVDLRSPQFRAMRKPIEDALHDQLKGWHKSTILRNAERPSMKDALGISHKSIRHSFRTTGNPVEIKQIGQAVDRANGLSKSLKRLGTFGKVLSVGSTVAVIAEDYRTKGLAGGAHTMGREAAGLAAGTAAGAWGGTAGAAGATAALLFFGLGTGGVGFVVIGIGAVAGSLIAGTAASEGAKMAYDGVETLTSKGAEAMVEYIIKD